MSNTYSCHVFRMRSALITETQSYCERSGPAFERAFRRAKDDEKLAFLQSVSLEKYPDLFKVILKCGRSQALSNEMLLMVEQFSSEIHLNIRLAVY